MDHELISGRTVFMADEREIVLIIEAVFKSTMKEKTSGMKLNGHSLATHWIL